MDGHTSYMIQKNIRDNNKDLQSYMLDLKNWEEEAKRKEKKILSNDTEEEKREDIKQCTKADVEYVKEVFERGKNLMKTGKYDKAVPYFTKAINKFNKNPIFFLKRAKCQLKLEKAKLAEADCSSALALDPKIISAKIVRSRARERLGQLRGACLDLQDVLILDPTCLQAKEELDRLKPLYEESLRQSGYQPQAEDPDEPEESKTSAQSELILDRLAGSESQELLAIQEEKIQKANREKEEGNKLFQKTKWKEAIDAYSRAILYNPEDPIFFANRALCFLKTNEPGRAELDCCVALRKNPRYVKALMRRATARRHTSNLWGARQDVKQVIALESNNLQAKMDLEKLNLLIDQKLYRDYEQYMIEKSKSEEELRNIAKPVSQPDITTKSTSSSPKVNQKTGETAEKTANSSSLSTPKSSQVKVETAKQKGILKNNASSPNKTEPKVAYVQPAQKSVSERSKKPLIRVPIKFIDNVENSSKQVKIKSEKEQLSVKKFKIDLAKSTSSRGQDSDDCATEQTVAGPKSKIEEKCENGKKKVTIIEETVKEKMDMSNPPKTVNPQETGSRVVYVLPVDRKPHQRSKKPLQRIPIKFI